MEAPVSLPHKRLEVALAEGWSDETHETYERALETSRPDSNSGDNDRLIVRRGRV